MADKRWRGAVFDACVAALLALSVYEVAVYLSVVMVSGSRWLLVQVGVL